MIIAVRIAGRVKNKIKDSETLKRLNLDRKFTAVTVSDSDSVRMGMVKSVAHMVAYGSINDDLVKKLSKRKGSKDNVYHLHPPRGGFRKSSKVAAPKGILGFNEDISKLVERML